MGAVPENLSTREGLDDACEAVVEAIETPLRVYVSATAGGMPQDVFSASITDTLAAAMALYCYAASKVQDFDMDDIDQEYMVHKCEELVSERLDAIVQSFNEHIKEHSNDHD